MKEIQNNSVGGGSVASKRVKPGNQFNSLAWVFGEKHAFSTNPALICDVCNRNFIKISSLGQHKLSAHSDTWAVLDLLESGMDEDEVNRRYDKCIGVSDKKMGIYKIKNKK